MTIRENGGAPDPATVKFHPAAEMFPLLEGAELEALVEDIRANGLREPIKLNGEGLGLDGRNRLRACGLAGVEPRYETWTGPGSEIEYILSVNMRRRHMNESQRAMVAAKLKETLAVGALERKRVGRSTDLGSDLTQGRSAEQAALMLNVSPSLVKYASRILHSGDAELIRAVHSGDLSVWAAAKRLRAAPKIKATPEPGRFVILESDDGGVMLLWAPVPQLEEIARLAERRGFRDRADAPEAPAES